MKRDSTPRERERELVRVRKWDAAWCNIYAYIIYILHVIFTFDMSRRYSLNTSNDSFFFLTLVDKWSWWQCSLSSFFILFLFSACGRQKGPEHTFSFTPEHATCSEWFHVNSQGCFKNFPMTCQWHETQKRARFTSEIHFVLMDFSVRRSFRSR